VEYRRSEQGGRVFFDVAANGALPSELGDVLRFASGDARGMTDAQPLNLPHPLVRAAIDDARRWGGGAVTLSWPPDASPELHEMAGQPGILAIALVDYAGFEPVQRVVAAAVVDGTPVEPALAARLAQLRAMDADEPLAMEVDRSLVQDALDEAVFLDQREVERCEQEHFERALGQLERFVDDKVLVCRRERAAIAAKLRAARERRDQVVGATERERVEVDIMRLAYRDEELERRIQALESREDEVYRRWRNEYHDLRFRVPTVTRLFEVRFQIANPATETSC
jgi:hypothetical protein